MEFKGWSLTAVLLLTGMASAQVFTLKDLGRNIQVTGVNNYGQVSGQDTDAAGHTHALIWNKIHGRNYLAKLPGDVSIGGVAPIASGTTGINNHGDVVGFSIDGGSAGLVGERAVLWPSSGGVLEIDGGAGYPSQTSSAFAINDNRQVTGITGDVCFCHAFFWSVTTGAIWVSSARYSSGTGIDAQGTVVGWGISDGSNSMMIWSQAAGARYFPNLAGTAISNGYIIGRDSVGSIIWNQKWGPIYLGSLPGQTDSTPTSLNKLHQVVGYSGDHAFFWTYSSKMMDLNKLIKARGWVLNTAVSISDNTQIVGMGKLNGVVHGYLLTVVPKK